MDLRVLLDWMVTEMALKIACWDIQGYSTKKTGRLDHFQFKGYAHLCRVAQDSYLAQDGDAPFLTCLSLACHFTGHTGVFI